MVRGAFAAEHVIAKSSLREYAAFVSSAQEREQTERKAGGAGLAEAGGQSADGVEAAAARGGDIDADSEATEADVLLADAAAACRLDALTAAARWRRVARWALAPGGKTRRTRRGEYAGRFARATTTAVRTARCSSGRLQRGVVALLRAGATVQARSAEHTAGASRRCLTRAWRGGDAARAAEAGTAPRCTDNNKQTLLHWCARGGNVGTLNAVLATGQLAVDSYDRWHRTPLAWAVVNGHCDAARALLAAGASVRARAKTKRGNLSKSAHMPAEGPLAIALRLDDGARSAGRSSRCCGRMRMRSNSHSSIGAQKFESEKLGVAAACAPPHAPARAHERARARVPLPRVRVLQCPSRPRL